MSAKIKLKTLAAQANVSISTASRVMAHKGYVSPEARERVLNVLGELTQKEMHSVRNAPKVALHVGIVLAADEFVDNDPGTSVDILSLRREIEGRGNKVTVIQSNGKIDSGLAALGTPKFDIFILYDSQINEPFLDKCRDEQIPVIFTNGFPVRDARYYVDYDNTGGAEEVINHLLDCGHRNIGFISGFSNRCVTENRLDACRDAMQARGITWDNSRVEPGFFKLNGGYQACTALLERHPDLTAIFALNDLSAVGAIRAIKDRGKRVPEDISVAGFDDMEIATYSDPPLTTVSRFSSDYNCLLSQAIEDLGRYPDISHIGILLATRLVIRKSTAQI